MNKNLPAKPKFKPLSGVKIEHLLAGVTGGVASTLLLHPLDLMKIRFAVSDANTQTSAVTTPRPHYTGMSNAMMQIFRQEGIRGFYRGVTPNVWGAGSAWGLYFLIYNGIKSWYQGGDAKIHLGPTLHMVAAAEAGVLTLVITNPIWVVKTRLCLQFGNNSNLPESTRYKGMIDALLKTYRYEGLQGLYKGFIPGVFGVSHGALQFMAYEELKAKYNTFYNLPTDTKLTTVEYLSFAALSKLFAAVTTYPYQVVRARLQDQHSRYRSVRHCVRETWRYEGTPGFYRGLAPYLFHVMPNICVVFLVYEWVAGSRLANDSVDN